MITVAIVRYPGSNCDIETKKYFEFCNNNVFYIWHNNDDINLLTGVDLLVLPGGFAFGDRIYNKATETYTMSPGTMALNSPVTKIIKEAVKKEITILGICNGFQILTKMGLLPGELKLNRCGHFVCKKVKCRCVNETVDMYIANSFGNYYNEKIDDGKCFLRYQHDNNIAGICDKTQKIFGMMPHPERNNFDFKHILFKLLLPNYHDLHSQLKFDKAIKSLMFSEHISYKTSRKYLKKLHTQESWVVQGPGENAGIVDIGKSANGEEYCIAIRIESHNHPTYINPYEGAATGVGVILRDIFTMGARPIAIMDFLRFGIDEKSIELLNNAVKGISYYGNCVGVPNIGGDCKVHKSFNTNPLVNVCSLGIVKKKNIIYGNALTCKSLLIYVGSKTGNEGVNGAAMASNTFVDDKITDELKSNVQKSDPFLEKLLLEACCEISEKQLVEGMQDMGAGGLLCASLEIVKRGREKTNSNMGCEIYLEKIPIKYEMEHSNILISESQERMLIVCQEEKSNDIFDIFKKWDLEFAIIGETTSTGLYNVYHNNKILYTESLTTFNDIHDYTNISNTIKSNIYTSLPKKMISKQFGWELYDSTVGNRTLKGPDKPGSYSILDIYEVNKQLILTWGETFDKCYTTMKKFVGVKPLCIVNCLNFGDPKYSLDDFENTINDLAQSCYANSIPVVGGNVSLYNTTGDTSIYPTPIIVMMGITN